MLFDDLIFWSLDVVMLNPSTRSHIQSIYETNNAVLLDHGIYKRLDEEFRLNYCQLWKAMITLDTNKILQLGEWFGVPKYSKYFPLIFTGRSFDR